MEIRERDIGDLIRELEEEIKRLREENEKLRKENAELREKVIKDPLTEVLTKVAFLEELKRILSKRERGKNLLLFIDIDKFKEINDNFGHQKGDEVLKKVAEILRTNLRKEDLVCRFGGDEFVILLEGKGGDVGEIVSERLKKVIQEKTKELVEGGVTISVGIREIGERRKC
jgi:diguanylate cyclase (GGDEF)-like protein